MRHRNLLPHHMSVGEKSNALTLHENYKMNTLSLILGPWILKCLSFESPNLWIFESLLICVLHSLSHIKSHFKYSHGIIHIIGFGFNLVCTIGELELQSFGEERRTWELKMKKGVSISFLNSLAFMVDYWVLIHVDWVCDLLIVCYAFNSFFWS